MNLKRIILAQVCLVLGIVLIVSCTDSSSNSMVPQDQPPQLPSAKSMSFDLSIFSTEQADSNSAQNQENYQQAVQVIGQIEAIQSRNINLIQDLLANAETAEAEELEDGTWEWNYASDTGRRNYGMRLIADHEDANEIQWDLYITSLLLQGQEKHFMSGTTNSEVTSGTWTYYNFSLGEQTQQPIAELAWEIDENEDISMEFKILGNISLEGSQMNYHTEGATRTIVLDPANAEETIIEVDSDTGAGFIISPDYNKGKKACWDEKFENVTCPES